MSLNPKTTIFKKYILAHSLNSEEAVNKVNIEYLCLCAEAHSTADIRLNGFNNSSQSNNMRISQVITNNLGGRTTFGNTNISKITRLNGIEGQSGGLPKVLKNKF